MIYINEGHRPTMVLYENRECDLCDKSGPLVNLIMPMSFGTLNICQDCIKRLNDLIELGKAEEVRG